MVTLEAALEDLAWSAAHELPYPGNKGTCTALRRVFFVEATISRSAPSQTVDFQVQAVLPSDLSTVMFMAPLAPVLVALGMALQRPVLLQSDH